MTSPATVYHTCHRESCHFDNEVEFEIINFMELIGESMGFRAEDVYRCLKNHARRRPDHGENRDQIAIHGLDDDAVRTSLLTEYANIQPMPALTRR